MPGRPARRRGARRRAGAGALPARDALARLARLRRAAGRHLARLPLAARRAVGAAVVIAALAAANWAIQAARKPTELLGLVAPPSPRAPAETWARYGPLFREHSTAVMRPELLAALAQAESAGDPLARTYWRWQWTLDPLEIYAPASSAVGLLQLTDGTFAEARRYCVHHHEVARDGECWFNGLYVRTVPSHAIEMTSARLTALVAEVLADRRAPAAGGAARARLAAVIHLCGRERGRAFAARGFRPLPGERCGDHDLSAYLANVERLERAFARLASGEDGAAPPRRR